MQDPKLNPLDTETEMMEEGGGGGDNFPETKHQVSALDVLLQLFYGEASLTGLCKAHK